MIFFWEKRKIIHTCLLVLFTIISLFICMPAAQAAKAVKESGAINKQNTEYNKLVRYKQKKNTCENAYDTCMREIQKDPRYCKRDLDTCIATIKEKPKVMQRQLPEEEKARLNQACAKVKMFCSQKNNSRKQVCKREQRKCNWYFEGSFHY